MARQTGLPEWDEGPVEVALSRVLSAVGYHQPPVYYLSSFMMSDPAGSRVEGGGRFRLDHEVPQGAGKLVMADEPVRWNAALPGTPGDPADVRFA